MCAGGVVVDLYMLIVMVGQGEILSIDINDINGQESISKLF